MSWHKEVFKNIDMENLKINRLKRELENLKRRYLKEPQKHERDIIDRRVTEIKKEIEKIQK